MQIENPHIGLYLAAVPQAGGIYQYALSLIDALVAMQPEIRVTCFVEEERWRAHVPSAFRLENGRSSRVLKAVGRGLREVSFELRNRLASVVDRSVEMINRSDCDLVVFPSQDSLTYQINKKSLTAIHDLMHRYEGQCSEYQKGVSKKRDRHYQAVCKVASGVLVDSDVGKSHVLESYAIDPERVHVLPFVPPLYLLDEEESDIRAKYRLPNQFFFYPAQFWEHKNHEKLVEAVRILKEAGKPVHMVFIGSEKNSRDRIQRMIGQYGLVDSISVLGFVPIDEMSSFYRQATAMVFASLAGPTNIPPMEAMLLGCPAIVSDAYAMPQQVGDGALLMDARNPRDIAEKMERVLESEELREDLIQRGYDQISRWNQDSFNERFRKILFSVVE